MDVPNVSAEAGNGSDDTQDGASKNLDVAPFHTDTDESIRALLEKKGKESLTRVEIDRTREWLIDKAIAEVAKKPPVTLESMDTALTTVQRSLQNDSKFSQVASKLNLVHIPFSDSDMANRMGLGSPADQAGRNWTLRALLKAYMVGTTDDGQPVTVSVFADGSDGLTQQYARGKTASAQEYQTWATALDAFGGIQWSEQFSEPAMIDDSRRTPSIYLREILQHFSDPKQLQQTNKSIFWRFLLKFPEELAACNFGQMAPDALLKFMLDQADRQKGLSKTQAAGSQVIVRALVKRRLDSEAPTVARRLLTVLWVVDDPTGGRVEDDQLTIASEWFRGLSDEQYHRVHASLIRGNKDLREKITDDLIAQASTSRDALRRLIQYHIADVQEEDFDKIANLSGWYELVTELSGLSGIVDTLAEQIGQQDISGITTEYEPADLIEGWLGSDPNKQKDKVAQARNLIKEKIFAQLITEMVKQATTRMREDYQKVQLSPQQLLELVQLMQSVHEDPSRLFAIDSIDTKTLRVVGTNPTIREQLILRCEFVKALMQGDTDRLRHIVHVAMQIYMPLDLLPLYDQVIVAVSKGSDVLSHQLDVKGSDRYVCEIPELETFLTHDKAQEAGTPIVIGYSDRGPMTRSLYVNGAETGSNQDAVITQVLKQPVEQWVGGVFGGVRVGLELREMIALIEKAQAEPEGERTVELSAVEYRRLPQLEEGGADTIVKQLDASGQEYAAQLQKAKNLEKLAQFFAHVKIKEKGWGILKTQVLVVEAEEYQEVWSINTALLWWGRLIGEEIEFFDPKQLETYKQQVKATLDKVQKGLPVKRQAFVKAAAGNLLSVFVTQEVEQDEPIVTQVRQPRLNNQGQFTSVETEVDWLEQMKQDTVDLTQVMKFCAAVVSDYQEQLQPLDASLVTKNAADSPIMKEVEAQLSVLVYQHLHHRLATFDSKAVNMDSVPENLREPLIDALKKIEEEGRAVVSSH